MELKKLSKQEVYAIAYKIRKSLDERYTEERKLAINTVREEFLATENGIKVTELAAVYPHLIKIDSFLPSIPYKYPPELSQIENAVILAAIGKDIEITNLIETLVNQFYK